MNSGPAKEVSTETKEIINNLEVGSSVYHDRFGKGKVIDLEGVALNQKATIDFAKTGRKQLLLRFAKLKLI